MLKKDYERLLDILKITMRTIKVIRDENNPENRKTACALAEDMLNHLFRDIKDVYERNSKVIDTTTFSGRIEEI